LILALVAFLAAATPVSAWTVSAARLERAGETAVLRLAGRGANGPLPHEVFTLPDPWRVVVDLFGAEAPLPAGENGAADLPGVVQGVRWSLWQSGPAGETVRYVIDCGGPVRFRLEPSEGALAVFVDPVKETEEPGPAGAVIIQGFSGGTVSTDEECTEEELAAEAALRASASASEPRPLEMVTSASFPAPTALSATGPSPVPTPVEAPEQRDAVLNEASEQRDAALIEAPEHRVATPVEAPEHRAATPVEAPEHRAATPIEVLEHQDAAPTLGSVDAGAAAGAGDTRPMNLDVQGADIRTVIRSIAEYGGANIVADREVDGPVTVRLTQMPWRQALDIVCQSAGLVTLEAEGVIRIATLKILRDEGLEKESSARKREELQPLDTRVFNIRYASAKELKDAVAFVLSKRGSANIDERTNTLLVSDIAPRIMEVEKLVGTLDTETRQVEITARLVDVDRTAARQLGIQWTMDNLHSNSERVSGSVGVKELPASASGTVRLGVVRGFGNLDATIEALERENRATLISSPRITTVNNRKAKILVGKEIPLIVLDIAGNATTELKKVGISLEVTPYINSENRITMDLKPEVSDLSSQATVQGGIVFTTTLADTRVMVNDGETAVIGGLIRTSETRFTQGIPILRSLPLIGALFRSSDTRKENRELLIFVSPKVVEGMAEKR
jgi:type IV pilus secretin PilQ/predicted competence protein